MTEPKTIREKLLELARRLIGYSHDPREIDWETVGLPIESAIGDVDGATDEDWLAFDAIVYRCADCDWWHDANEINEDGLCMECADGEL